MYIHMAVGSRNYLYHHELWQPVHRQFLKHPYHKIFLKIYYKRLLKTSKKISSQGIILWLTTKTQLIYSHFNLVKIQEWAFNKNIIELNI